MEWCTQPRPLPSCGLWFMHGSDPSLCEQSTQRTFETFEELTAKLVPTLERLAGKDNVRLAEPITGAEDFSYFSQVVPGFYFRLGVVPEGRESGGHHTPTFYAADESVPVAMKMMTSLVVDFLDAGAP